MTDGLVNVRVACITNNCNVLEIGLDLYYLLVGSGALLLVLSLALVNILKFNQLNTADNSVLVKGRLSMFNSLQSTYGFIKTKYRLSQKKGEIKNVV